MFVYPAVYAAAQLPRLHCDAKRSYQCRVSVQTPDAVCQWQGASDIDIDLQGTLPPGLPDPRPVIPSDLIVPHVDIGGSKGTPVQRGGGQPRILD